MLRELIPEHHLLMQVITFLKANAPHRSALWKLLWNSFYTCRLVGTLNVSLPTGCLRTQYCYNGHCYTSVWAQIPRSLSASGEESDGS
jgi:hypothetical protein